MMLERLTQRFGYTFATLQFRSQKDPPRQMTGFLRTAQQVLITLPVGYEAAVAAGSALQQIRNTLTQAQLTLVHTGTRETGVTGYMRCEVVRVDQDDINRFALPRRSLLQRIMSHPYDVAIDLNLDFVLHTAYICRASGASIRVGCVPDPSETFFNVQIRPAGGKSGQRSYDSVTAALAMF
jgi:hypothetical protein